MQGLSLVLRGGGFGLTVCRNNNEAVHVARREIGTQLFEFGELRVGVHGCLRANKETGKFRSADALDGIAKSAFTPRAPVVVLFESIEAHGEEEPRHRPKLVYAAAERSASGLDKDVPTRVHNSARQAADFRMEERFKTANPYNRRGTAMHSFQANIQGEQLQIRSARW